MTLNLQLRNSLSMTGKDDIKHATAYTDFKITFNIMWVNMIPQGCVLTLPDFLVKTSLRSCLKIQEKLSKYLRI